MENLKKTPLSLQLNVEDFAPASNDEKKSLVVMRESVNFWKDGIRRLKKNKIAMVSFVFIIAIAIAIFAAVKLFPSAAFGLVTATILCSCGASANIKLVRMERYASEHGNGISFAQSSIFRNAEGLFFFLRRFRFPLRASTISGTSPR